MNIMTWNVNRFNGIWDAYYNGFDLQQKARVEYAEKIIDKIREFLREVDDIVVLQEVPYQIENNNEWKELWKPLIEKKELLAFSNLDIGKKCSYKELYYTSHTQTVAITTKESTWKSVEKIDDLNLLLDLENNKRPYANRYVEMYNADKGMSLIGIHLNCDVKFWKKLASDVNKFSVIVGDFNYNNLFKNDNPKERKMSYEEILKTHMQLIPDDIITNNKDLSGIDKIFIKNNFMEKYRYSISVLDYSFVRKKTESKLRYSDHNLCICQIENIR